MPRAEVSSCALSRERQVEKSNFIERPTFYDRNSHVFSASEQLKKNYQIVMQVQQIPEGNRDMDLIRECGESTASIWLQFLDKTENKVKMINTIVAFYKITAKMCRALEIFEEEFKKEEDKLDPNCGMDNLTSMIRKHLKRKESFFKVRTVATTLADKVLNYINRNTVNMGMLSHDEGPEQQIQNILNDLLERESLLVHLWTLKKQRLDHCQEYLAFESRAKQALEKIHDTVNIYMSMCISTGSSIQFRQQLLKEQEDFHIITKNIKECVKMLIQQAEGYCNACHSYADEMKKWATTLDLCYRDLSLRMEKHSSDSKKAALQMNNTAHRSAGHELDEKNHKSSRRRIFSCWR